MKKILITTKSSILQHAIESTLIDVSFVIRLAATEQEVELNLMSEDISLIVMDNDFPRQKTELFINKLHRRFPNIPIIVIFKALTINQIVDLVKAGAHECISRPIDRYDLVDKVRNALNTSGYGSRAFGDEYDLPFQVRRKDLELVLTKIMKEMNQTNTKEPELELPDEGFSLKDYLREQEGKVILSALDKFNGSQKKTAAYLGISERNLRYKIQEIRDKKNNS